MSFVAKLQQAREALAQQQRLSVRALGRELALEGDDLDEIVEELVEIQKVAKLDGKALVWIEGVASKTPAPLPLSRDGERGIINYTPKHLAEKILANRSAMEGEKKQVTVLFCDVANSMGLAEALGPEAWHETLNEFFEVLTAAVHEFEGTVNQYTGDGIMALFGAPIAAEDHARRACMAALAIQKNLDSLRARVQKEHDKSFAARIGINTGAVVVGKIGDDLRMDYTAQGQVVGIAARLEAKAEPNAVLISKYSAKQVEGFFALDAIGLQDIKGVSEPLDIFKLGEARADKTRLDLSRERGFSHFVGREAEMALMRQALKRAAAGNGQVISMVAPPGTGKSRLCWEFAEYCRKQGYEVATTQGKSHGRMAPYEGMSWNASYFYRYQPNDPPETKRQRIRERLADFGFGSEQALALTYEYCGVPDPDQTAVDISPETRRQRFMHGTRWVLNEWCKEKTQVVIFEDLQWLDEASLTMLDMWIKISHGLRILLILNYRPEFSPPWQDQEQLVQRIPLQPLDHEAIVSMLSSMLGGDASLSGLSERIIQTSSGNPFFVEEIVRSLIEQGDLHGQRGDYQLERAVTELPLPSSVQSVIAARIDRLDEQDKRLLQSASVIGREFDIHTLSELTGLTTNDMNDNLQRLERAEFINSYGSANYQFRHALTQDVVYGSLLQSAREPLHRQVAELMEQQAVSGNCNFEVLSGHWEKAGILLKAALTMHQAAKATAGRDLKDSLRLRREFLRLERAQPANPALVKPGLSARRALIEWSLNDIMSSAEARQLYDEACALANANNNPLALATAWGGYALRLQFEGRLTEACELADQLLAVIENTPDTLGKAVALSTVGAVVYGMTGLVAKGLKVTEQAMAILDVHPEFESNTNLNIRTCAINWHALSLGLGGQARASLDMLKQRVAVGDYKNDIMIQFADGNSYFIALPAGIVDGVEARNARIAGRLDAGVGPWWECCGYAHIAMGHVLLKNWQEAERHFETAIAVAEGNEGVTQARYCCDSHLPYVKLRLGKTKEALTLVSRFLTVSTASGSYWLQVMSAWTTSRVWREARGPEAVSDLETLLLEWEKTIDVSGLELYRHLWWWETARLAELKSDAAGYRDGLQKALASAEESDATGHTEEIRKELAAA